MELIPELKRQQELESYQELQGRLLDIFRRHNPLGLSDDMRRADYVPEVETVLPRLRTAAADADVRAIVCEEISRWRPGAAPDDAACDAIAREAAEALARFRTTYET